MKQSPPLTPASQLAWTSSKPPLLRFLNACHADFAGETSGAVANYIPELGKADPAHFGISLATLDGHVYEVGDTQVPFTIQSMSKPFVFALALDTLGAPRVESVIGVEPSGDPFNSIRLNAENHPFNPMVNAGAIACSGLIHEAKGDAAFDYIRQALGRFAGRDLDVDDAVYSSESLTGDRNRAIGYLLRTNAVIRDNVAAVLEVYFRQCAILVTARDIAVMAATLANRGINPVTGEQVLSAYAISRTLSVMTSSGMYDYAGEWIYRVGLPAKSGVGGGILAALPARLGLGSYSPKLDKHGNSVRGIKVCEALSSHYDLHMLNRSDDARNSIIADYDIGNSPSRRVRRAQRTEHPRRASPGRSRHRAGRHAVVLQRRLRLASDRGQAAAAVRHLRPAPRHGHDPRRHPPARRGIPRTRGLPRHRDPVRHPAIVAGMEDDRGMDGRAQQHPQLLFARCRHRMGGRPGGLSLRRRDRLLRGDRTSPNRRCWRG